MARAPLSRLLLVLPPAGCLLLFLPAPAAVPRPAALPGATVETRASVFTASAQDHAALDLAPDGRVAVAWDSKRQEDGGFGVYARFFDAWGRPLGHEVRVNRTVAGMQTNPAVAFAADGASWFAWESFGQDGDGQAVVARRFAADAAGRLEGGPELPVNLVRDGDQAEPALVGLAGGGVLAAWSSTELAADGAAAPRVRARRVDDPAAAEIALGERPGAETLPALAALPGGGAVAAWGRRAGGQGAGVVARLLDAGGRPDGPEFLTGASPDGIEPSVAASASGVLLAWLEPAGADGYAVVARRFDLAGAPLGPVLRLAEPAGGWQSGVAAATAPAGAFVVCWNEDTAGGDGIDAVAIGAGGALGARTRLNRWQEGRQTLAVARGARRVAGNASGRLALAWHGDSGGGDGSAANLTLLLPAGEPAPPAPALGEPQAAPAPPAGAELLAIPPIWNPNWVPQARLRGGRAISGDFGFEAVPGTGWTPPDPELAVGPDRLCVIVNGRIACFDKAGVEQWFDEIENSFGFWGAQGATGFVFDPEVTWDPHDRRFLAMACERGTNGHSYFLLAVSKDETPDTAGDWWKYRLDVTSLAGDDIDSPNLAVGTDTIFLSADFFAPQDKYLMYFVDKTSVLSGGAPVTASELIQGAGQQSFGIPVVYDVDDTLYVVQSTEFALNTTVILHAVTQPFTAYSRVTETLTVPAYTYPNQPPQKGTSSRPYLFEPRFWSCAMRNGSIWAVHHVNDQRARARWYEFPLNGWPAAGTPALGQWGEIDLGDGIHTFFPSIHVDADSNVALTFARSAANEYISIGRALRAAGDAPGTLRPAQVVQVSANAHTSGRWGDYSGTQAEPDVAGVFWGHHEFTNGSTSSWRTWAARYDLRPIAFELSVTPLVAGQAATIWVAGATPGRHVYFGASLTGTALYEVPALSTTLSIDNPQLVASVRADAAGVASYSRVLGAGMAGLTVWLQAAEFGRSTNWIQTTIQ